MSLLHFATLLLSLVTLVLGQIAFKPGGIPLAVRSPYFQAWTNDKNLNTDWPEFWNGHVLGWLGVVRVDGKLFEWMGHNFLDSKATLLSTEIKPSRTILSMQAGPMKLTITYLSPIEPSDWVRQSFPFSYVSVEASSTDGGTHDVEVYMDVTGEWLSPALTDPISWSTSTTDLYVLHASKRDSPPTGNTESDDMALDGTFYLGAPMTPATTWQSGVHDVARNGFKAQGGLNNTKDTRFRAINDAFPILAVSVKLGEVSRTTSPVVFAVGYVRDPVFSINGQLRSSYFWTKYSSIENAFTAFIEDFQDCKKRAEALDEVIYSEALLVSTQYAEVVSLGSRQLFASIEVTAPRGAKGATPDIQAFMKDVGTDGGVNPVASIYAAFPAFLYLNASFGGLLLKPILEAYKSTELTGSDLGSQFPSSSGNLSPSKALGIENSASMLILALAHAKYSGDGSLLRIYEQTLKTWANFLSNVTLQPNGFTTYDGVTTPNQSNLAVKGIIAIQAMSEISTLLGNKADATNFAATASAHMKQWQSLAVTSDRVTGTYGQASTWSLMYNLYADRILQTKIVPASVYDLQTNFYKSLIPNARGFGLGLDSSTPDLTKSHWTMLVAAIATDDGVRNTMVSWVRARAALATSPEPFPAIYNPTSGEVPAKGGIASPAQGAIYSLLALTRKMVAVKVPSDPNAFSQGKNVSDGSSGMRGGTIAGVVVGVVLFCMALGLAYWYIRHFRKKREEQTPNLLEAPVPFPGSSDIPPQPFTRYSPYMTDAPMSGKTRQTPVNYPIGYAGGSGSGGSSSLPPSDSGATSSVPPDQEELRNEVIVLRQQMAQLHQVIQPPPEYS